ncbi:Aste57867_23488 [Aphanomyces stellatus]|uniref:Aste57867_23488 protein n=1 Tax=Aphanomyces stellatus TaxID=120398 RepID=A0A485LMU7_9STRA|nr:hypothetical protein As57867_023417 [Aphanomyces stellatus]VFU00133.1 Aste57867_23488 [Aphanomyces stellatus]
MVRIPCNGCSFANLATILRCIRCNETLDDKDKIKYLCDQVMGVQTRYAELEESNEALTASVAALMQREAHLVAKERRCDVIMVDVQCIAISLENNKFKVQDEDFKNPQQKREAISK